jgi:PAS domain S-box-containing protein
MNNDCSNPLIRTVLKSTSFSHRWRCLSGLLPVILFLTMSSQIEAQTDPSILLSITWQMSLIVFLTVVSVVLSTFLAVYAWQRRNKPGVLTFAWFMTAIAESSIASTLSMLSQTEETARFWTNLIFLGTSAIPVLFLIFILQYSGRERWLSRRRISMLFIIPLVTQVVVWTNDMHGLFIQQAQFAREGALMLVQTKRLGPWFGVHTGYSYLLLVPGIVCIILMIIRPFHLYRKQAIGLFIGIIPPILNGMLITFNLIPALQNQLTPFSLTLMGSIFAWILFHHQFLDVVPVARDVLIDSMSDSMLVLDIQHRIVDLNPAAQHFLGPSSSRYIGQSAFDVLQSWHSLEEHLYQDTQVQVEIMLDRHETHHHYDLRISPLTDKQGQQTGKLIVLRDITERKRAEAELLTAHAELKEKNAQLHELNASKDKFFSIISHDLRSPFSALLGFSQMLEQNIEKYTCADIKQRVHWLHVSAERLYALLENLLTWSRLQCGAMQQQPRQIQLIDIAEDNVDLFAPKAEQKKIVLSQTVSEHLCAYADYSMVDTVVRNLVSNALKFTPAGGHIEISAREQNDFVEIAVSDTGIGIYPGDLPKLFRIDVQYTHIGTAGEKGTGLGLILCQELVERNSGKIWVESEVGKGTIFRFTLPPSP